MSDIDENSKLVPSDDEPIEDDNDEVGDDLICIPDSAAEADQRGHLPPVGLHPAAGSDGSPAEPPDPLLSQTLHQLADCVLWRRL